MSVFAGIASAALPGSSIAIATSADRTCLKLTLPFFLNARLAAGLRVCVHHENVLEMAEVHGGNEDRALEGPVLAFGDLNDLTEDQAFRLERFQVISDRGPGGDHGLPHLHALGLEEPVPHERSGRMAPH